MLFEEFIKGLNDKDRENYNKYSKIRGIQSYKIVFECLKQFDYDISYSDVNSLVIYDKAIKDVLYKYLGTLEEFIKNYIFMHFDFNNMDEVINKNYLYFKDLPKLKKVNNEKSEITELYKRYSLSFGDMISLLKEYDKEAFKIKSLEKVRDLRNDVMHHLPLLFSANFDLKGKDASKLIQKLIDLLPSNYRYF